MKIAVIFGSRSTEHDVSIISGVTVAQKLKENKKYQVYPIYITKNGKWEFGGNLDDINAHRKGIAKGKEVAVLFSEQKKLTLIEPGAFGKTHIIDLVFPIMHGLNGEDGTLQGVLELAQVPYTCPNVLGSALGMNKIAMKDYLKTHNIPLVNYVAFYRNDWQLQPVQTIQKIIGNISYPIFVKPANLGSSIGITKANNQSELENAVEVACFYDDQIICEAGVLNLQEINCAVLGDSYEQKTSVLEEPVSYETFLTFAEKYINAGGTMQGVKSKVKIPAQLPEESMTAAIQTMSKTVFKLLHCHGAARIDFLVDIKAKVFYVNEINTIPGSLQHHLWEKSGISFAKLLEEMIDLALKRERDKIKNSFVFKSSILQNGKMKS